MKTDFDEQFKLNMDDMFKEIEAVDPFKDFDLDFVGGNDFDFKIDIPTDFGVSADFDDAFSFKDIELPGFDFEEQFDFDFDFDFSSFEKEFEQTISLDSETELRKDVKKAVVEGKKIQRETRGIVSLASREVRRQTRKNFKPEFIEKIDYAYYQWGVVWDQIYEERNCRKQDKIIELHNKQEMQRRSELLN